MNSWRTLTPRTLALGGDFAPAKPEDWRKLVDAVLKGAPFERLVGKTYDDLRIGPLYARSTDARPIAARVPGAAWQLMQRLDHPDPALANAEALHDLANGATGLTLVFAGAIGCYGYGIEGTEAAIGRALDGVLLDAGVAIELDLSPQAKDAGNDPRRPGAAVAALPRSD